MSDIEKLLQIAKNEIGYLEKETNSQLDNKTTNVGDNNYTKYVRDLVNEVGAPYVNGYAWCQSFVSWCFLQAFGKQKAKELLGGWSAYTPTSAQYFKNMNSWYSEPKKGDVVYFKNSTRICHTGIVYGVDKEMVYTVEGNTSSTNNTVIANGGGVFRKMYSLDNKRIAGYGRPKYDNQDNVVNNKGAKCIDVSGYNPIQSYERVKASGVEYAILKIIRKDLRLDKLFDTHYNGFTRVSIPIQGVYQYSYATTVNKARNDAKQVVEYLKKYNLHCKVYLDVEDNCQKGLGTLLIDIINAYNDVIESNGYNFALYTGQSFYNTYIKPYREYLRCRDEWIARYYKGYNQMDISIYPNEDYKPNIDTEIEGWQYTSSCIVDGINKPVDMSVLYNVGEVKPNKPIDNGIKINNVVYNCNKLNVREKPNALPTTKKVGLLTKGDKVNIYGYKNNFYQIGDNKWASAKYIDTTKGMVTASALNVREGTNTNYNRIDVLPKGTVVKVLNRMNNGWYMIQNKNYYGYVSDKYLKEV